VGDTIRIELKTKTLARNYFVADELLTDSLPVFFQPDIEAGEKISYTYTVATADKEWLYIYYNDEVVMRYKLKMKKEKADLAIRNKFQND